VPTSTAASTVRRNARAPSRCPSATGTPRAEAQRPFPSMMSAIERGTSSPARSRGEPALGSALASELPALVTTGESHLHDLGLFHLQEVVDRLRVLVRDLLDLLLCPALLVVADVTVHDELLQVLHYVAPHVPDR